MKRLSIFLLLAASLLSAQVVIPGSGPAVPTPVPGSRTAVVPGDCAGTDKVIGITATGTLRCGADIASGGGSHVFADTTGLGANHTTSGLTAGQVLRATGATTAAFQVLPIGDTSGDLAASRVDDGAAASTQALFSGAGGAAGFRAIADGDVPNSITIDLATTASTANAGDSATAFFSLGALELAIGGTNQTSWTASRCVQVNAGGTALESAAAACGAGGVGDSITVATVAATDPDFIDSGRIDFVLDTGASPDTITADIVANSVNATHLDETAAYAFSSATNTFVGASFAGAGDTGDAGPFRLANNVCVSFEASPTGTDACILFTAAELLQLGSANFTADLSGNVVVGGSLTVGTGIGTVALKDTAGTESVTLSAPSDVTTSYTLTLPGAVSLGFFRTDGSGTVTFVGETGTVNVVRSSSPSLTTPTLLDVTVDDLLTFAESAGDATCAAGDYWIKGNSTSGKLRGCENGSAGDLIGAGGASNSFATIGTATADSSTDTLTITDSLSIDLITTNDPEDLSAALRYDSTLAGDPALAVSTMIFSDDCPGGGFLSEGSTANTNEQLICIPSGDGADTTRTFALLETAQTFTENQTIQKSVNDVLSLTIDNTNGGASAYAVLKLMTGANDDFQIFADPAGGLVFSELGVADRWKIDGSGHWLPAADNTYDVGSASNAVRDLYLDGNLVCTNCVTSTDLIAANKTFIKSLTIFDPVTGDSNDVQMYFAQAITITRVACSVAAATSVTIQLDERAEATPNTAGVDVMTSALVCDTDSQATTSFTNAAIALRVPLNLQITAVSGTPGSVRVHVEYLVD